ncbi:hypothetical protein NQZ79_g589 [Umbelopsis isabellina]|nr:hypothetical protein NQZ79_g589 [Umbelopsis isabellina]
MPHGMLYRTTSRYICRQAPPLVTWRESVGRISHARYKNVQLDAHNFSTKHSMFIGSLPIEKRLERYTQYEFTSDLAQLGKGDRAALKPIVEAAKLIDKIYFRQAWAGNEKLKQKLEELGDEKLLTLFNMYKGPWAREDDNVPFVEGVPAHPKGANYYPEDMSTDEFKEWVKTLSPEKQKEANGYYSVVRRSQSGTLYTIPYAEEYKDLLEPAAQLLEEAANLVEDKSLETFLRSRAKAFLSNDYLDSEVDWLHISKDSALEITIGPYENYTDELFSLRAAYESYVHVRDFHSSKLLEKFSDLQFVEDKLPIPDKYKNKELVAAPIVVVNQVYAGGDVAVPTTAAYNLPNDEEAIKRAGSKLVLIKNAQEGKFKHVLTPIAKLVIAEDQLKYVVSPAFTTHVLLHEVSHSNGPHHTQEGHTVRSHLQEYHSAFEEAKADITALFAAPIFVDKGIIDDVSKEEFWVTFLASAFRSIRFGIQEAHGLGQAMQLNYLLEKGGFEVDADGRYRVNFDRIQQAVQDLTHDILILQGDGDKAKVDAFAKKYGKNEEQTKRTLDAIEEAELVTDGAGLVIAGIVVLFALDGAIEVVIDGAAVGRELAALEELAAPVPVGSAVMNVVVKGLGAEELSPHTPVLTSGQHGSCTTNVQSFGHMAGHCG